MSKYNDKSIEELEEMIYELESLPIKKPSKPKMFTSTDIEVQKKYAEDFLKYSEIYGNLLAKYLAIAEKNTVARNEIFEVWKQRLFSYFPKLSEDTKNYLYSRAYEYAHASGYSEIRQCFEEYAVTVEETIEKEIKNGNIKQT